MTPLIIQQDWRKAVVNGNRVQLFKLKPGNKKRTQEIPVWPETECKDNAKAQVAGFLWAMNAAMDFGEQEQQTH